MKIIFFGSAEFAKPSLEAIVHDGYSVVCVVTQPDKQKGRGMSLGQTVIKETAKELGLEVFQPDDVNSPDSLRTLQSLNADLFLVLAYGQLLSQELLNLPKIMPLNVHASLLPAYRGAAPINWAIIKGEKLTGNTLMKMTRGMDRGPIILQSKMIILEQDTADTLEEKLSRDGATLLIRGLKLIAGKEYKLIPQDEKEASLAPKLKKADGLINWQKSAAEIYNLIRGCGSWPGAFTYYKGKILKIYQARPEPGQSAKAGDRPGEIIKVDKEGISVAAAKGILILQELQIEGKKKMAAAEFILGHKVSAGENFGKNSCKA